MPMRVKRYWEINGYYGVHLEELLGERGGAVGITLKEIGDGPQTDPGVKQASVTLSGVSLRELIEALLSIEESYKDLVAKS